MCACLCVCIDIDVDKQMEIFENDEEKNSKI